MRERTQFSLLGSVGLLYYWSLLRYVQEDSINLWKKLPKSYSRFWPFAFPTEASDMMLLTWVSEATLRQIVFILLHLFIHSNCIWINKCHSSPEFLKSIQVVLQFVAHEKYPAASHSIPATQYLSSCSKRKTSL